MAQKNITCLIPFFNENTRLLTVLAEATKIPELHEIICVDDGSTDDSAALVKKQFPQVIMVQLPRNQGKSAAVKKGLENISTPWVFLLDADLLNVSATELSGGLRRLLKSDGLDMLIFRLHHRNYFVRLIRHDILMSGERVVKTSDLKEIFKKTVHGYQLEVATNNYMLKKNKKVAWYQTSLDNTYKFKKWKLQKSLRKYFDEWGSYTSYKGLYPYLKQIFLFAHQNVDTYSKKS